MSAPSVTTAHTSHTDVSVKLSPTFKLAQTFEMLKNSMFAGDVFYQVNKSAS